MTPPRVIAFLLLSISLAACTGSGAYTVEERRLFPADVFSKGEGLTVVGLTLKKDIVLCVDEALRTEGPDLKVIPPREFREAMSPWFDPDTAPTDSAELARFIERGVVQRRIQEFGVRYLLALSGETTKTSEDWGNAAFGIMVGGSDVDKRTFLNATLLDLKRVRAVSSIYTSAEGRGGWGLIVVVPYGYLPPATEAIACGEIAKRIVAYLKGKPALPDVNGLTPK